MRATALNKLDNLLFLTKESLRQVEKKDNNLNFNLKYWQRKGKVLALKRGFYLLTDRFSREADKDLYLEYLANRLYSPSYVSLEYVLNKYSLLTEAVTGISSITLKTTKIFNTKIARFSYYSVSPKLFCGYEVRKFYDAPVLIAKKSKALFDYLYLRFLKTVPIERKTLDELRINWENVSRKDFLALKKYAQPTTSKRVKKVINLIQKIYYA